MTAAGRLTSVYQSLRSYTREEARSDSGAATVQSKNRQSGGLRGAVHCRLRAGRRAAGVSSSDGRVTRVNLA